MFQKQHRKALAKLFDGTRNQLRHLELFPHGILHAECTGGDVDLLPNRRVTIGVFPRRRVDAGSSIGRCVALVEDDEYADLMHAKASLPKTRLGEGHREAHIQ